MNPSQVVDEAKQKFNDAVSFFEAEAKKLRTGRAHPTMLDGITAEAYGTPTPLVQLATISAPEPQLLQISPFDPNNLAAIVSAIRDDQSLGFNPTDDGRVIRVPIPPLNEERRRDIAKQLGSKVEEAMVRMRNARHEAIKEADAAKKDRDISEDECNRIHKQVDELMQQFKTQIEELAKAKEAEIMTV